MSTALDEVARELGALLRQIKSLHSEITTVAEIRLEMPALAVLVTLDTDGPQRPSGIADVLALDLSTISRQLSALERDGRVERQRDPVDQRAQIVDLTPAGRDLLALVRATRVARLAARLPHWSKDELESFAALLARFTADISQPHPDCQLDLRTAAELQSTERQTTAPPSPTSPSPTSPSPTSPSPTTYSPTTYSPTAYSPSGLDSRAALAASDQEDA